MRRGSTRRAGAPGARRRLDRRDARAFVVAPRQERRRAIDRGLASHDFADATCRAGASAPRSRARTPTTTSGVVVPRQRAAPACSLRLAREVEERRQRRPPRNLGGARRAAERRTMRIATARPCPRDAPSWWCRDRCRRAARGAASVVSRLTDVQLELPALAAVARDAPELERADFGHPALERHRHASRPRGRRPAASRRAGSVPRGRRPSPRSSRPPRSFLRTVELRNRNSAGSPTARPNSTAGDRRARAFLHPERHDAERLERRRETRARPASRSRCRRSRCARRRCGCGRRGRGARGRSTPRRARRRDRGPAPRARDAASSAAKPSCVSQPFSTSTTRVAQRRRLHHAAVEEDVGRAGEAARAAPDRPTPVGVARLTGEKAREVPRDRRIGGVRAGRAPAARRAAGAPASRSTATVGKEAVEQHLVHVVDASARS